MQVHQNAIIELGIQIVDLKRRVSELEGANKHNSRHRNIERNRQRNAKTPTKQ